PPGGIRQFAAPEHARRRRGMTSPLALPLQGACRAKGTVNFVDLDTWQPCPDQFRPASGELDRQPGPRLLCFLAKRWNPRRWNPRAVDSGGVGCLPTISGHSSVELPTASEVYGLGDRRFRSPGVGGLLACTTLRCDCGAVKIPEPAEL
ncbi:hypothetical protein WDA79_04430, partial [Streptomyces sp. A475]|uniref:hypothetical protein n=1 Tax=Streptomyces sp. A475 TaxID=3131976 RepID=UPI0030C98C27